MASAFLPRPTAAAGVSSPNRRLPTAMRGRAGMCLSAETLDQPLSTLISRSVVGHSVAKQLML
jgi:hypothetical protein